MGRWVLFALVGLLVLGVAGVVLTTIPKMRLAAAELGCKNNLKGLAFFAAYTADRPGQPAVRPVDRVPAGTVPLADVPPDGRLSWAVAVLPGLDQRRQDVVPLLTGIDEKLPWAAEPNQQAGRTRLPAFLCPANPPPADPDAAPTSYVGVAGLGADAALLVLPPPPAPVPPRAGAFRYDAPTPFDAFADGLSQSLLFGERSADLGPWLRGGPATVRGLDDAPGVAPLLGPGGQFGGNHPSAHWAMADGAVRAFTGRVDPKVLFGLATIAGKESDAMPGE